MAFYDVKYKFKRIGKNVFIGTNVYFRYPEHVEIGDNVIIDEFCYFTTRMCIGNYVHISPHCSVIGGKKAEFIIGDFAGLSAGCRIVCSSDDYLGSGLTNPSIPEEFRAKVKYSSVTLQKHVVIGTGCVILPGIVVAEGSAVGAMSLINKNLDAWGVYHGIPAVRRKDRPSENILKLEQKLREHDRKS